MCIENSTFYIGQSKDYLERYYGKNGHLLSLQGNRHCNPHLQSIYNKYGQNSLRVQLIESCNPENLNICEQKWLNMFKENSLCLNICFEVNVPPSWKGRKHTEETKLKLRNLHLGKKRSNLTKDKLKIARQNRTGPFFKGRKHTEESKRKMSQSKLGRVPWNKGIPCTEEQKEKIRKTLSSKLPEETPFFGRHHTEETKENLRNKICKTERYLLSPDGELFVFFSTKKFCAEHNLNRRHISQVLNKKESQHKGWKLPDA